MQVPRGITTAHVCSFYTGVVARGWAADLPLVLLMTMLTMFDNDHHDQWQQPAAIAEYQHLLERLVFK